MEDTNYKKNMIERITGFYEENKIHLTDKECKELSKKSNKELNKILFSTKYSYNNNAPKKTKREALEKYLFGSVKNEI
jgi:hypothetical protein